MSCCGQSGAASVRITQQEIDEGLRFELEYTGGPTVKVRGPVTGAEYVFSGMSRRAPVDPRDAPAILRQGQFRMKRVVKKGEHHG